MARFLFPGGNTALGFFSFYDHILPEEETRRLMILKGGPGVGKSTFMRRVGESLEQRGCQVEYLLCSSDPHSLDGVVARGAGFAMIDGTAPHTVDPRLPGAADSLLNLGVYLDEAALESRKDVIWKLQREISACFAQAYRYLAAALPLRDDCAAIRWRLTDEEKLMRLFAPWLETVTANRGLRAPGRARSLFASAITPEGCVHHLDSFGARRVWRVSGEWAGGAHRLLSLLRHEALVHGLDVEAFYCPLNPHNVEHLYLPAMDLLVTTDNRFHSLTAPAERTLCLDDACASAPRGGDADALRFNAEQFDRLLRFACLSLARAKALHDELEAEYIPRMDFDGVERCYEKTLSQLPGPGDCQCLASSLTKADAAV